MEIGTTFAVCRHSDVWAYRIIGETPKRWNVEIIKKPDRRWSYGPHSGRNPCFFSKGEGDMIPFRGEVQLAAIAAAWDLKTAQGDDAKERHRERIVAIRQEYEAALRKATGEPS